MELNNLSLSPVTLAVLEEGRYAKHDDVDLVFSLDKNVLLLKQAPELDSSGVYIACSIPAIDLKYLGRVGDSGQDTKIRLQTRVSTQTTLVLPSGAAAEDIEGHKATVAMCCSITGDAIPAGAILEINILSDHITKEELNMLVDIFDQLCSNGIDSQSLISEYTGVLDNDLSLSESDFDYLDDRGASSTDLTIPIDNKTKVAEQVWFSYHDVEVSQETTTVAQRGSQNTGIGRGGRSRGRGPGYWGRGRGIGRGRGQGQEHVHDRRYGGYRPTFAQNTQPTGFKNHTHTTSNGQIARRVLGTEAQARFHAVEADRVAHMIQVRNFFENGAIVADEAAATTANNTASVQPQTVDVDPANKWATYTSNNGINNNNGHDSAPRQSSRTTATSEPEPSISSRKDTSRQWVYHPLTNEEILESIERSDKAAKLKAEQELAGLLASRSNHLDVDQSRRLSGSEASET